MWHDTNWERITHTSLNVCWLAGQFICMGCNDEKWGGQLNKRLCTSALGVMQVILLISLTGYGISNNLKSIYVIGWVFYAAQTFPFQCRGSFVPCCSIWHVENIWSRSIRDSHINTPTEHHNIFHVDWLRSAADDPLPSQPNDDSQPEPLLVNREPDYIVKKIMAEQSWKRERASKPRS